MAIPHKKIGRKDTRKADAKLLYYPQLVTMGQNATLDSIAYRMKETSSLSLGDIQSVLSNFVEAMRSALYNGQSVNIRDFGVFSLSARTQGTELEKDCTTKNIKAVKINFRASSSVRPNLTSTRAGDKLEFIDIVAALAGQKEGGGDNGGGTPTDPGNPGTPGDDDDDPNG